MKKKIFILFFVLITVTLSTIVFNNHNNNDVFNNNFNEKLIKKDLLTMNLEQTAGSGDYKSVTYSEWPREGYIFNAELSKCENGGELSWDNAKKVVLMSGNISDKCYVYFNVARYDQECNDNTLSCYIAKKYGNLNSSSIYYHDASLKNGANDLSYRYAGSSSDVNNYICFGSTEAVCPADNLYRIIGVFKNNELKQYYLKLIKSDFATSDLLGNDGNYAVNANPSSSYLGNQTILSAYKWNFKDGATDNSGSVSNNWNESLLNTKNLNLNFLTNIGTIWSNKIAVVKWNISGNTRNNLLYTTVKSSYQSEIINPTTSDIFTSQIGLMYVSDYGYAANPSYWTYKYSDTDLTDYRASINANWMYTGDYEWTITKFSDYDSSVAVVLKEGNIDLSYSDNIMYLRPTFYLNSDVSYYLGDGTINNPYKIVVN